MSSAPPCGVGRWLAGAVARRPRRVAADNSLAANAPGPPLAPLADGGSGSNLGLDPPRGVSFSSMPAHAMHAACRSQCGSGPCARTPLLGTPFLPTTPRPLASAEWG